MPQFTRDDNTPKGIQSAISGGKNQGSQKS